MGGVAKAFGNVLGGGGGGLNYVARAPDITELKNIPQHLSTYRGVGDNLMGDQSALAQALLAQSQGQGPNPAQMMMQQAQDRANQQGAGMIASAKGMNPALAARMAAQNTAAGQQSLVQNTGILGAQQQLQAQGQLGQLYGQMGGQNQNQQQMLYQALANQNQSRIGADLGSQQINAGMAQARGARDAAIVGGILGAGGQIAAAGLGGKAAGGFIPGQANVSGDSHANDTVPAMLSPGEIVVPRSAAKDSESAKAFIDHLMGEKSKKKRKG